MKKDDERFIEVGDYIKLLDEKEEEEILYNLVGDIFTSSKSLGRKISPLSPMGRALLGKRVGDEIIIDTLKGRLYYEVLEIYS